jgi:hypothetical protein
MQIRRDLLVEAGHRCAITRCKTIITVHAHIVDFAKSKDHSFGNLIALCPNCHELHTRRIIDTKALRQYKANLSVLNGRYGTTERRLLQWFADHSDAREVVLSGGHELDVMFLVRDGFLELVQSMGTVVDQASGLMTIRLGGTFINSTAPVLPQPASPTQFDKGDKGIYRLTDAGVAFIAKWLKAEDLEEYGEA